MSTVTLSNDQLHELARLVAEELRQHGPTATPGRMVDADALAQALGVARSWVYAHSTALGGVRLGTARGRLRFDVERARAAFVTVTPESDVLPARRGRPRQRSSTAGSILRSRPGVPS